MHAYQPQRAPSRECAEHACKHQRAEDLHLHSCLADADAAGHLRSLRMVRTAVGSDVALVSLKVALLVAGLMIVCVRRA